MPEEVKPKPVVYRRILEQDEAGRTTRWYVEMGRLIATYHPNLVEFKIGLFWKRGWKPDKDGRLILGQARKASESERQCHGYHGFVYLNEEWFHNLDILEQHKIAVLDHELCHFDRELDPVGETRKDENQEPCIRMVKHDLEEFVAIVDRYGLYTDNLRRMAGTMHNARVRENGRNNEDITGPDEEPEDD